MAVIFHLHDSAAFYPGKEAQYAFYRRLGGPECLSARFEEEKITYPCRESNYGFSVPHSVART